MSVTERQRAVLSNRSPKNAQRHAPDPTWKAQQAFIRATRRGSKKHATMEKKLELLDAATTAIPAPAKVDMRTKETIREIAKSREMGRSINAEMQRRSEAFKQIVNAQTPKPEEAPHEPEQSDHP